MFPVRRTTDERIFLAVFFLYIKSMLLGVDLITSQQTILPTSRWIDIQHLSCIFYLLSSSSSSCPNQTTPSAPPAPASHGWLRLHRPTIRTLHCWPVPPSIPPHVLLFSGDVSPNRHPRPNQSTLVLPSTCDWTGASSTAPVRSVRGLTIVLRLGSLAVRSAPPSCVVNVVNNREEQGDDCMWRG